MNFTTDTSQVKQFAELWRRAPDITREELLRAVTESDLLLQGELMQALPKGAGGLHGAGLAGTLFTEENALADNVIGLVATKETYAEYVETGVRAHMPPLQPIEDWVQAVLHLSGEEAKGAAFAIRWKQFHHGIKANPVWQKIYTKVLPAVHAKFDQAAQRILGRLAGGAA
ncbi:hypothetical protein [Dyella sp. 20L07]|uniref:hypothetical protein n=1 Tax=Dyella sp. 20L07 TaxID=3384240 RepID=UPI003D293243